MSETALPLPAASAETAVPPGRRLSFGSKLALGWEIVKGGFVELWAHKLRSTLTLTLLMLGVFALVVMSSVMDGVMDKIAMGFSGMSWDGTVMLAPDQPATTEEQKRFAMSPGLRWEDLPRLTAPDPRIIAFLPRATKDSAVKVAGGTEHCWVNGVWPDYAKWMNRPIAMGRGLTDDDELRRSTVAVVGATLASKLFGGADPVGRDITVEGVRFRVVGVQAPSQIFTEELWYDANGVSIPLQTYMDRIDPDHKLTNVAVKLARKRDTNEISALMIGRAKQAHHGIEDIKVVDLESEAARAWQNFMDQIFGWTRRADEPRCHRAPRRRRRRALGHADLLLRPPLRDRPAQGDGRLGLRDPDPVPPRGLRARGRRRDPRDRPRHRPSARPSPRASPTASSSTRWACSSPGSRPSSSPSSSACIRRCGRRACRRWRP